MSQLPNKQKKQNTILVVDDYVENLRLIKNILEDEGHKIILTDNGFEALNIIDQTPPDLILLDVFMPEINGVEVTKRIKNNPNLPFIPIVLITASDQANVVKCLDSGADEFIKKPVIIDELLARVRSLLRLKNTIDERDEIANQRQDFVSRLTHDLRTPLIATDRMYNLLLEGAIGEINPELTDIIESLDRSNQNLLKLVNTLLEVYRYEADKKILNFTLVNLTKIIREVIEELKPLAEQKQLEIKQELSEIEFNGDSLELRRLITNLIGNAIKFTDQGYIKIQIINHNNILKLIVADTGQGIAPEEQKCLFNRFAQGHHQRGGSGLGLHLCRQIVESHQGQIMVKSKLAQGTIFQINFPQSI